MLARLTLVVAEGEPALTVPSGSVLHEGTRDYVFVRRSNGNFERRLVTTGRNDDRLVAISQGLQEEEQVVVRGVTEMQTAYAALK
jgi:multidrug efflux pump subunit AcrA (membrane-fusion protein)